MTESIQYIVREGQAEYAVVPIREWKRIVALAEDSMDVQAAEAAAEELRAGEDEIVPAEVARRLIQGESPVAVWRGHRGLTQQRLADATGVTNSYISQIESGTKTGLLDTLRRIAAALRIDLDDLVAQ